MGYSAHSRFILYTEPRGSLREQLLFQILILHTGNVCHKNIKAFISKHPTD